MSLIRNITGMITNPEKTIEEIAQKPYIEEAFLIVGITAILSGISAYFANKMIIIDYSGFDAEAMGAMGFMDTITPYITIISAVIGVMIIWLIAAGVIHLFSISLGGEGRFTQLLVINGYANIPIIFGVLIGMILMVFIEPVTIAISTMGSPTNFMDVLMSNPYYQGSIIISYMMKLWTIGLIFLGVKNVHSLSNAKALIAISIPLIFFVGGILMILFSSMLTNMFV